MSVPVAMDNLPAHVTLGSLSLRVAMAVCVIYRLHNLLVLAALSSFAAILAHYLLHLRWRRRTTFALGDDTAEALGCVSVRKERIRGAGGCMITFDLTIRFLSHPMSYLLKKTP